MLENCLFFKKSYTRNGLFKGRKNFLVVTASRRLRGNGEAKVLASVVCTEDSCVLLIMPKNFYAERDSFPRCTRDHRTRTSKIRRKVYDPFVT